MYYSRLQNLFNSIRSILSENFFFLCSFIKDFCKVLTSFHRETWPGDCSQCGHPDLNYMFFFTLYFFLGFQEEMRPCSLQNHLSLNTLNKKKRKTRSTALARMYPALWKILQIGRSHRMETMSLWVAGAETLMSSERGLRATRPSSPADSAWEMLISFKRWASGNCPWQQLQGQRLTSLRQQFYRHLRRSGILD